MVLRHDAELPGVASVRLSFRLLDLSGFTCRFHITSKHQRVSLCWPDSFAGSYYNIKTVELRCIVPFVEFEVLQDS